MVFANSGGPKLQLGKWEVNGLYSVNGHIQQPLIEWCVFRCGFISRHCLDMCSKEIGLCVQKFDNHSRLNTCN